MSHHGMRIGGTEINGGRRGERYSPADARKLVSTYAIGTLTDVDAAVLAAAAAFPAWRDTPVAERVAIVERVLTLATARRDELAALLSAEAGKPTAQARGEIDKGREVLAHAVALGEDPKNFGYAINSPQAGLELSVERHPYGVFALITAWNFPWILFLWKAAYALISGNTLVWKPAEQVPAMSRALCDLFAEAGLPPGVLNLVYGGVEVGEALVRHPLTEGVSFTGSTKAGFQIARLNLERVERGLRPCALLCEMGGKNPAFVMLDADLDAAVAHIAAGGFFSAGERCTATGLVIVHQDVASQLIERLVARTKAMKVGLPNEDGVQVGPLVDERQLDRVAGFVDRARQAGCRVFCGGHRLTTAPLKDGWFYEPTVVLCPTEEFEIAREEVFGPVLPVVEAVSFANAAAIANGLLYGLKSAIHTADRKLEDRWAREVRCGGVHGNDATVGAFAVTPFGGTPNSLSAIGLQECGPDALRPYQRPVSRYRNVGGVGLSAAR